MPPRRSHAVVLAVDGPSAAGKSTLVARATRALGWVPLAEAYDRIEPPVDLRYTDDRGLAALERTLLDEESRRWRGAQALRQQGWTVLADTDFLGPLTYTAGLVALGRAGRPVLEGLLLRARELARRGVWGLPDALVYLTTPSSVRRKRTSHDPGRHPPDLAVRHERVGRLEERFYREVLPAAYPQRIRWLRGDLPPQPLVVALRRLAGDVRPLSVRDRTTARVVDLFDRTTIRDPGSGDRRRSATVKKPALSPRAPRG